MNTIIDWSGMAVSALAACIALRASWDCRTDRRRVEVALAELKRLRAETSRRHT